MTANRCLTLHQFDTCPPRWDKPDVKPLKKPAAKKTVGISFVGRYRPRMNKLTPAERRQLRDRAMVQ